MKGRLIAYGMIRKGHPERCVMVVLDDRCWPREKCGVFGRWLKIFRPAPGESSGERSR